MPRTGVAGTNGTRNGRAAWGSVFLITSTAAQTIAKANSVPMFARFSSTGMGKNAAMRATKVPVRRVDL
jgi:hypothetical protein